MKIVNIKLDKILTAPDRSRFTVTFGVEFEDETEGTPYFSWTTVGVPFDDSLSHADLVAKALYKLHGFFRATGTVTRDQIADLYARPDPVRPLKLPR